jgi:DNA helicase II / ATP-dependent DNA helicase PcrA
MTECQRCPPPVVKAANRLMALSEALAMVPISDVAANLHVVTWSDPHKEAAGMARTIVSNLNQHPGDRHLVMVTRRKFGYWLRDRIAELDPAIGTELSFSEGLLETWAVREAFLFFSLIVDPDRPTWRAWLAYKNSVTGEAYKAPNQNADAYLRLLASADEHISSATIAELASEKRSNQRGQGGSVIWDRAKRFLELQEEFEDQDREDPLLFLNELFDPDLWIGGKYKDAETAGLDMQLLLEKASVLLAEEEQSGKKQKKSGLERLRSVAQRLRYQIPTREPSSSEGLPQIQVATLWGAKGVTAEHVYLLGTCDEAIPRKRRDEYPGTDEDYIEEQRRLFYVSITRSKKTLVISRAMNADKGEGHEHGASYRTGSRLQRNPQDVTVPEGHNYATLRAVNGDNWNGC